MWGVGEQFRSDVVASLPAGRIRCQTDTDIQTPLSDQVVLVGAILEGITRLANGDTSNVDWLSRVLSNVDQTNIDLASKVSSTNGGTKH
jgi:hypothetical protein